MIVFNCLFNKQLIYLDFMYDNIKYVIKNAKLAVCKLKFKILNST